MCKTRPCLTCGLEVVVKPNPDAEYDRRKWLVLNPDGSLHPVHTKPVERHFYWGMDLQGEMAIEAFGRAMDDFEEAESMYSRGFSHYDIDSGEWV